MGWLLLSRFEAAGVFCIARLVVQNLWALFVVWHKHANALNLPDMLAPKHESADFEEIACAKGGLKNILPVNTINFGALTLFVH